MTDLIYPQAIELNMIAQEYIPRLEANRPVFTWFPIRNVDAPHISWEQEDNWAGLQQLRGLGGQPNKVQRPGGKRLLVSPGIYGEFMNLDEVELTERRQWGTFNQPIDVTDLVVKCQKQLLVRRYDRIEKIMWDLITTGTFSVAAPFGGFVYSGTYTFQSYNASTWGTAATATPLADMRAVQLKSRGKSVRFDQSALALMNRTTLNKMLVNTNAADIYGRRTDGLATANSLPAVNALLSGEGLPNFAVYDEGYYDDSNTFQLFIPDDVVVVVGNRVDGSPIGFYSMTRNANNPGMAPGPYMKLVDDPDDVPRLVTVHDGHNGGPEMRFPSAIVIVDVS